MKVYTLIDKEELDIYGMFLNRKDATSYLKTDIREETIDDFVIVESKLEDDCLQELNRKIVEYLADKHL